ncbi:MAG: hypothetical protein N3E47_01495 [Candidatus Bathyarchaeota archaeon]|nr:hypothetical protein [Candidatus Bathyarchaeota archaeon]
MSSEENLRFKIRDMKSGIELLENVKIPVGGIVDGEQCEFFPLIVDLEIVFSRFCSAVNESLIGGSAAL